MKIVTQVAFWLTIVGALNWGLVGLVNLNLVSALFGETGLLTHLVYDLVGLSGVWMLIDYFIKPTTAVK